MSETVPSSESLAAELPAATPELPLKPGPGKKTAQPQHSRKGHQKRHKKHATHGSWKLVYADFVTVLMAFFIVVWVMLFDNISKRERIDTSCIEPVAKELKELIAGDAGLQSG
jgi:hypothetical protein